MKHVFIARHVEYLLRTRFLPVSILSKIEAAPGLPGGKREVELNTDELLDIEELCAERMPLVGFDAAYDVNEEAKLLEELIDWLYTLLSTDEAS